MEGNRDAFGGAVAYAEKPREYFSGTRADWVSELPNSSDARILEVGCGAGATGALAMSSGKCGWFSGLELDPEAAQRAEHALSEAVCGDIESLALPWPEHSFDVLFISEVLEHLVDPWSALRKLRPLLKTGARVFASSPNAAHYRVILMLMRGQWRLDSHGTMDRTHLRWFTPKSYRSMFESAGYTVERVGSVERFGLKARVLSHLSFGRAHHLLARQIDLRARCG